MGYKPIIESLGERMWREEARQAEIEADYIEAQQKALLAERTYEEAYFDLCVSIEEIVNLIDLAVINLYKKQNKNE